jgi:hypothetical protein
METQDAGRLGDRIRIGSSASSPADLFREFWYESTRT